LSHAIEVCLEFPGFLSQNRNRKAPPAKLLVISPMEGWMGASISGVRCARMRALKLEKLFNRPIIASGYQRARETGMSKGREKRKKEIGRAGCEKRGEIKSRLIVMKRETTRYETRVSN